LESDDIERLFQGVLGDSGLNSDAVRQVFSILIRATLEYRDQVLASRGIVVTVEDVRTGLDWLVPAFATGNVPEMENKLSLGLLKTWLRELKAV